MHAPDQPGPALRARVDSLLAERYAPVPRDKHVVAVDVNDLALVMHYADAARQARRAEPMTADTAAAWQALSCIIACHGRDAA